MNVQDNTKHIPRDRINFFAHVDMVYPTQQVIESKSRLFMSLFQHGKGYVVLKTSDAPQAKRVTNVGATLYRKDSMLLLQLAFHTDDPERGFSSFLPVNAIRDAMVAPKYPSAEQGMTLEIHLVEYLNSDVLSKVVRAKFDNPEFVQLLCEQYEAQRTSEVDVETMTIDTKALLTTPLSALNKYRLETSSMTILKDTPEEHEPLELVSVSTAYNDLIAG